MSKVQRIATAEAPSPAGHYAQATVAGGLVHVSGQLPIVADGAERPRDFEAQAKVALGNMLTILAAAGCGPADVLKVNAYIVGIEHWPAFNGVFAKAFGEARPARVVVPVPELHHGYLVEVDAVAVQPG